MQPEYKKILETSDLIILMQFIAQLNILIEKKNSETIFIKNNYNTIKLIFEEMTIIPVKQNWTFFIRLLKTCRVSFHDMLRISKSK